MRTLLLVLSLLILLIVPSSAYYSDSLLSPVAGSTLQYNESYTGERNAGQWFTFELINASGLADVKYHFTVADAEIKTSYQYRSDAWAQWRNQTPDPGKKFLFVWICGYSEGTSWIGWGASHFAAWIDGETIAPEEVQYSDIGRVRRGAGWSDIVPPRTIRFLENKTELPGFPDMADEAYGFKEGLEQTRMIPGKSNAYYGYLIYQIPAKYEMKDIQIAGWFGYYGTAIWNLSPRLYIQRSPEYQKIIEREQRRQEIAQGQRLSDRDVVKNRAKV
nr:hypothetical protein [uncultured Methanoregula sp.]